MEARMPVDDVIVHIHDGRRLFIQAKREASFENSPSWSSPAPRAEAATLVITLARHDGQLDDELRKCIDATIADSNPVVRHHVTIRLNCLWDIDRDLLWTLFRRVSEREPNRSVLKFFLNYPVGRLTRAAPDKIEDVLGILWNRFAADTSKPAVDTHAGLADISTFKRFLGPLHRIKWVVYCKSPFAGPEQVLRYLSRYTHRVAISNRRLIAADDGGIAFRWKDYRTEGAERWKTMTLAPHEFIRRFLTHVLPKGFQRIRHYGLFANGNRAANLATARELLGVQAPEKPSEPTATPAPDQPSALPRPRPCCGGRMVVIEIFERGQTPRHRASPSVVAIRIDTS
jgi:Putative transposase